MFDCRKEKKLTVGNKEKILIRVDNYAVVEREKGNELHVSFLLIIFSIRVE